MSLGFYHHNVNNPGSQTSRSTDLTRELAPDVFLWLELWGPLIMHLNFSWALLCNQEGKL